MKYQRAKKSDLPLLTKLWCTCFGDQESDVREFWKIFDKISVFVAQEKAPAAMLCALPIELLDEDGQPHPSSYLYAVCTAPQHRKKGICAKLMAYAETELKKEGFEFACLVPSSESLFSFYDKLGYKTAFYHKKYEISADKATAKITKINAAAYQNLRQMQLYSEFADYDESLIALNSGLYRIETTDFVFCAVADKHEDTLIIRELLPDNEGAAAALAAHLRCAKAQVRTIGTESAFGMAKSLCGLPEPSCSYLGLAFD